MAHRRVSFTKSAIWSEAKLTADVVLLVNVKDGRSCELLNSNDSLCTVAAVVQHIVPEDKVLRFCAFDKKEPLGDRKRTCAEVNQQMLQLSIEAREGRHDRVRWSIPPSIRFNIPSQRTGDKWHPEQLMQSHMISL